jgi:hypothetical protein
MNLYAYVGNDPMNRIDPFGLMSAVYHCSFWERQTESGWEPISKVKCIFQGFVQDTFGAFGGESIGFQVGEGGGGGSEECPSIPGLMSTLSTLGTTLANIANSNAERGFYSEYAMVFGVQNGRVAHVTVGFESGAGANLPYWRNQFSRQYGYDPSYDAHTHWATGVAGAQAGFSFDPNPLAVSGDINTTARAPDTLIGSFYVSPNEISYVSRETAMRVLRGGGPSPYRGKRC